MAGEGSRFGGTFKPFEMIGDATFIEKTYEPFKHFDYLIKEVVCVCTVEQEQKYKVREKLITSIPHQDVTVILLPEKTSGPLQTIQQGIKENKIEGPVIVCDCDHSLDVSPIFNAIDKHVSVIVPTWPIDESEHKNWSKVVHKDDQIQMICEKEHIASNEYAVDGIIGCIYFGDASDLLCSNGEYLSDALRVLNTEVHIKKVEIHSAMFYGDPEMYARCVDKLRNYCTVFCDIDGTLVEHKDHSDCNPNAAILLPGTVEKLQEWKRDGHKVILTSSRSEKYREELISYLDDLDIVFDDLVLGLPAGPRVLINDRKPSKPFTEQASSIEITRNSGISSVTIEDVTTHNRIKVHETYKGNSFATTQLISLDGMKCVRKHIIKTPNNKIHVDKLRRQAEDLVRFNEYSPGITPEMYGVQETPYELYYDMEYLDKYVRVDEIANPSNVNIVLDRMDRDVYSIRREIEGTSWVKEYLHRKIYPKLEEYRKDPTLQWLIDTDTIRIHYRQGKEHSDYYGLSKILSAMDLRLVKPSFLSPIHGDLTLENIMISNEDFKLIDMDGGDYIDAPELDLGKMCQSVIANYKQWRDIKDIIELIDDTDQCIYSDHLWSSPDDNWNSLFFERWTKILKNDQEEVRIKGMFYMATYFIRFIPFRMKISREHGIFAMCMAIIWLNRAVELADGR
jgi:hypothetical protein